MVNSRTGNRRMVLTLFSGMRGQVNLTNKLTISSNLSTSSIYLEPAWTAEPFATIAALVSCTTTRKWLSYAGEGRSVGWPGVKAGLMVKPMCAGFIELL